MKKGVFVQTFPFVKRESLSEEKTLQKSKSVKRINPSKEKIRQKKKTPLCQQEGFLPVMSKNKFPLPRRSAQISRHGFCKLPHGSPQILPPGAGKCRRRSRKKSSRNCRGK